jgi:hypothetical protein
VVLYGIDRIGKDYVLAIIVGKQSRNNRISVIMSKNQREVHTRPVTSYNAGLDLRSKDSAPTQAEGPTYIITHQSHPTLRAVTITYNGDIQQWIDSNPDKYIVHLVKL